MLRLHAAMLFAILFATGCTTYQSSHSPVRSEFGVQIERVIQSMQEDVAVSETEGDYSELKAIGLTAVNRDIVTVAIMTSCVETAGQPHPLNKARGWVCYSPDYQRETMSMVYTDDELFILRPLPGNNGFSKLMQQYGFAQSD